MFPYKSVTEFVRIIRGSLIRKGRIRYVDEEVPAPDAANKDAYWKWYNTRVKTKEYLIKKLLKWGTTLELTRTGWNENVTSPRKTYLKIIAAAMKAKGQTANNAAIIYLTLTSPGQVLGTFFTKFMLCRDSLAALGMPLTEYLHVRNGMRAIEDDDRLEDVRRRLSNRLEQGRLTWKYFFDQLREECGEDCKDDYDEETELEESEDEDMDEEDEELGKEDKEEEADQIENEVVVIEDNTDEIKQEQGVG